MGKIRQWIVEHELIVAAICALTVGSAIVLCTGCTRHIKQVILQPGESTLIKSAKRTDYKVIAYDNTKDLIAELEKPGGKIQDVGESMGNMLNVVCDKCGSDNIEVIIVRPEQELGAPKVKMSQYNPKYSIPLIYKTTTYNMKCRKCGFSASVQK